MIPRCLAGARRLLRWAAAVALLAAVMLFATGLGTHPAHADTPGYYNMTADANTFSLEIDMANAPLLAPQLLFASPGSAQARLDSFGDSTAYAAVPFIGQTLEGIGGLASGLGSGIIPPLPQELPGYVATSNPSTLTANDSQGPYTLQANSGSDSSTATAGIAAESGQFSLISSSATASTSLDPSTGSIASTGISLTEPFAIGNLVRIGTIQASATMAVDANGKLTQTSSLDLGSITVAGIPLGLTQNGLQLLGTTLLPPSISTLNTLLSSAGISIQLLPATKTTSSITSEGLQITETRNLPVEGASALIITIGQATAQLQYGLVAQIPPTTPSFTAPTTTPAAISSSGTESPVAAAATPIVASPSPSATAAGIPSPSSASPVEPLQPTLSDLASRLGPDALLWYLILAAAALALTAASRAAGHLAIRHTNHAKDQPA